MTHFTTTAGQIRDYRGNIISLERALELSRAAPQAARERALAGDDAGAEIICVAALELAAAIRQACEWERAER